MTKPPTVLVEIEANSAAPGRARHELGSLARYLPKRTYEDVQLLVDEIVARAVTQTATPAVVVKVAVIDGDHVSGSVTTARSPGAPVRVPESEAEVLGRKVLDTVATRWGRLGFETWFEISIEDGVPVP